MTKKTGIISHPYLPVMTIPLQGHFPVPNVAVVDRSDQNFSKDIPMEYFRSLLTFKTVLASSRSSVGWVTAQKKLCEKIKSAERESERMPVGKVNKRFFRPLIHHLQGPLHDRQLVVFTFQP